MILPCFPLMLGSRGDVQARGSLFGSPPPYKGQSIWTPHRQLDVWNSSLLRICHH